MAKRILLILILWIFCQGPAGAQEQMAAPDAGLAIQDTSIQNQQVSTDQSEEPSSDTTTMTDIHDINALVSVPVPVSPWAVAMWASIVLLAAGAVAGAWWWWKKRKKTVVKDIEAMLSPEDAALLKIQGLSPETEAGKAFYFRLSAILREYLQGRFHIDGLEMTTEELLPHVEAMAMDRPLKQEMKQFLAACDPVKFAGAPTRRERMQQDLDFVRGVVEKTAAALSPPEETTGDARGGSE